MNNGLSLSSTINIILLYVPPHKLINFMIQHKINQKVKYDAHHDELDCETANLIFCMAIQYNENLMITGLYIRNIGNEDMSFVLRFSLQHITHLIIYEYTIFLVNIYKYIYPVIHILNNFTQCKYIKYIKFINLHEFNISIITTWEKLNTVVFSNCIIKKCHSHILSKCKNLNKLYIHHRSNNTYKDMHLDCQNLHTFCFKTSSEYNDVVDPFGLSKCLNLRHVQISYGNNAIFIPVKEIENLSQLSSVSRINLSNSKNLLSVNALGNHQGLTHLSLLNCLNITSVSALGNCSKLRFLNISGCRRLKDVKGIDRKGIRVCIDSDMYRL